MEKLQDQINNLIQACSSSEGRTDLEHLFTANDGVGSAENPSFRSDFIETTSGEIFWGEVREDYPEIPNWLSLCDCVLREANWNARKPAGRTRGREVFLHWCCLEHVPGLLVEIDYRSMQVTGGVKETRYYLLDARGLTRKVKEYYAGLVLKNDEQKDLFERDYSGFDCVYLGLMDRWFKRTVWSRSLKDSEPLGQGIGASLIAESLLIAQTSENRMSSSSDGIQA